MKLDLNRDEIELILEELKFKLPLNTPVLPESRRKYEEKVLKKKRLTSKIKSQL